MKHTFRIISFVLILFVLVATPVAVFAAPARHVVTQASVQATDPVPDEPLSLESILLTLRNLGGFAALCGALVNAGKRFWPKAFPDGSAPKWSLILGLGGMIVLGALQLTGRADIIPIVDKDAGAVAQIFTLALGLIYELWATRKVHEEVLAGLPVIGKSNSGAQAGQGGITEITAAYQPQ